MFRAFLFLFGLAAGIMGIVLTVFVVTAWIGIPFALVGFGLMGMALKGDPKKSPEEQFAEDFQRRWKEEMTARIKAGTLWK